MHGAVLRDIEEVGAECYIMLHDIKKLVLGVLNVTSCNVHDVTLRIGLVMCYDIK